MKRQELQQQLKQLRKEGYVKEGFTLVASTADLAEEYHEAINRKRTHEAKLMQDAYECEAAFVARQAAQQESLENADQTFMNAEYSDRPEDLHQSILDNDPAFDWYDYEPIEVEQVGDVEALIELGFPLTCDVLGSWYGVYCNTDPDAAYNYDRSNGAVNRVIKSLLPEPESQGFHLLRKLRHLV